MREQMDGGAIGENPGGAGGLQIGRRGSGFEGDDACSGGFSGADSGGGVFDDDAIFGRKAEQRGALQIGLGMRLAVGDIG